MTPFPYSELFSLLVPQIILVLTALAVLAADAFFMRASSTRVRIQLGVGLSLIGCTIAIVRTLHTPLQANLLDGMILLNPLVQQIQIVLLLLTMLTVLLFVSSTFTQHVSEYLALILLATVSMMFLVSTQNLLLIFLALEMLSLSLYILTAFNKSSSQSAEAALKYFLFGGTSAAFLLFGFSLLYGFSNSTNLTHIASAIHGPSLDPLLIVAIVMVIVGLGFKVAAVPFHFWAPDVYQGAPAPSAAFIASGSKVAAFYVLYQVMVIGLAGAEGGATWHTYAPGWVPVLAIVAVLSMLLGNLVAIRQTSVRRLLAYSAMAHAGYMLIGILAHTEQSLPALLYYAITYAVTVLGAFGVVALVEANTGGDTLTHFAGLSRRAPIASFCMFIFLLSLAGIPPLAGFFGKFYLFSAALSTPAPTLGLIWLVVLAVAMSAVSLYYYLRVLKAIYVTDPPTDAAPIHTPFAHNLVFGLIAATLLLLGCTPNLLLHWLRHAVDLVASS